MRGLQEFLFSNQIGLFESDYTSEKSQRKFYSDKTVMEQSTTHSN
jgi:hypothetical protein